VKLMKNDPPPSCAEVGSVSGYTVGPNYEERLKNKLRNDAADKGANYVRLARQYSEAGLGARADRVLVKWRPHHGWLKTSLALAMNTSHSWVPHTVDRFPANMLVTKAGVTSLQRVQSQCITRGLMRPCPTAHTSQALRPHTPLSAPGRDGEAVHEVPSKWRMLSSQSTPLVEPYPP
jgi:hypothetical protein